MSKKTEVTDKLEFAFKVMLWFIAFNGLILLISLFFVVRSLV